MGHVCDAGAEDRVFGLATALWPKMSPPEPIDVPIGVHERAELAPIISKRATTNRSDQSDSPTEPICSACGSPVRGFLGEVELPVGPPEPDSDVRVNVIFCARCGTAVGVVSAGGL